MPWIEIRTDFLFKFLFETSKFMSFSSLIGTCPLKKKEHHCVKLLFLITQMKCESFYNLVLFLEKFDERGQTHHLNGPCFGYAVSFLSKRLQGYHPL